MKLCSSLTGSTPSILSILDQLDPDMDMVEIRADLMDTPSDAATIVTRARERKLQIIATCRELKSSAGEPGFSKKRKDILLTCIQAGATHVDVEVEAPEAYGKEVIKAAKTKTGCLIIVSYHAYEQIEATSMGLKTHVQECFDRGADIAKIAVAVVSTRGTARVMSLYDDERCVVALAMGASGVASRVSACMLGAPFTFCAWDEHSATAPGQLTRTTLATVYRDLGHFSKRARHAEIGQKE